MNINDKNISRNINIGFTVSLLLIVLICIFSLYVIEKFTSNYTSVKHTNLVIDNIYELESNINMSDSIIKSYLIKKSPNDLEKYLKVKNKINYHLSKIDYLTKDNNIQQNLINQISKLIFKNQPLDFTDINDDYFKNITNNNDTNKANYIIDIMLNHEHLLLQKREKGVKNDTKIAFYITIFVCLLAFSIIIISIFIINQFIRDKIKIEAELTENKFNLENMVEKRTLELKRSNEDLNKFAYVASHDLQEPLRTITSYTMLLERKAKDKLSDSELELMKTITDGALRMKSIILALLDYSKINSKDNNFKNVDLNNIIEIVKRNLDLSIKENDVTINFSSLPTVYGDESLLIQLFQNIISNSIKYRTNKNPKININAENILDKWKISIKDNGIGIEEKYFDKIFEVFQRLHTRDKYEGTGIGLSTCKRIIELHNGKIWLESKEDHGTKFFFTLPVKNFG